MTHVTVKRTYTSNVKGLGAELDRKLQRIVNRAARDGAAHIRVISQPSVAARAGESVERVGVITCPETYPGRPFWAIMIDKGTLGHRRVPLESPGKRKSSWKASRRRKGQRASTSRTTGGFTVRDTGGSSQVTYRRSSEALASGGIRPQYNFIRGKRVAERSLAKYLTNGL